MLGVQVPGVGGSGGGSGPRGGMCAGGGGQRGSARHISAGAVTSTKPVETSGLYSKQGHLLLLMAQLLRCCSGVHATAVCKVGLSTRYHAWLV